MSTPMDLETLVRLVEALTAEVRDLKAEVARLQGAHKPHGPVMKPKPELTEDTLYAIAAAVSAFLGNKARIRTIRHAEESPAVDVWRVQGRVAIQASHVTRR